MFASCRQENYKLKRKLANFENISIAIYTHCFGLISYPLFYIIFRFNSMSKKQCVKSLKKR